MNFTTYRKLLTTAFSYFCLYLSKVLNRNVKLMEEGEDGLLI